MPPPSSGFDDQVTNLIEKIDVSFASTWALPSKGQDPRLLNDAYLQNPIYTSGTANQRVDGIGGVRSMVATAGGGGGIESPTYTQLV